MISIMQGDAYAIEFTIKNNDTAITDTDVDDIEICIGDITKSYAKSQLTYTSNKWYFPITQSETFEFKGGNKAMCQVRVKFKNGGDVVGVHAGLIDVLSSLSKVTL